MFLRLKTSILFVLLTLTGVLCLSAQEKLKDQPEKPKPEAKQKKDDKKPAVFNPDTATPEQIAESVVLVYSQLRGRDGLKQIRKTTIERGKISLTDVEGKIDRANYEIRIVRGDNLGKEKIRFDQEFPSAKYSLVYNDDKVYGIYNNLRFDPREDAIKPFQNRIWHGIEALLRYKENESKIELGKREKIAGVDFFVMTVTDKQNRQTKYYVSSKTFRVMMLEYQEEGIKYKRKFYDFNLAQGTLVPYRTVLWADEKQIEESEIGTVTYGQKVDDSMFSAN